MRSGDFLKSSSNHFFKAFPDDVAFRYRNLQILWSESFRVNDLTFGTQKYCRLTISSADNLCVLWDIGGASILSIGYFLCRQLRGIRRSQRGNPSMSPTKSCQSRTRFRSNHVNPNMFPTQSCCRQSWIRPNHVNPTCNAKANYMFWASLFKFKFCEIFGTIWASPLQSEKIGSGNFELMTWISVPRATLDLLLSLQTTLNSAQSSVLSRGVLALIYRPVKACFVRRFLGRSELHFFSDEMIFAITVCQQIESEIL